MYKGNRSRFFPLVVIIVIIAIVVFGLVSLVRLIFNSNPSQQNTPESSGISSKLLDTSSGQSVSMIVRGPIVADEHFYSFEVTISPTNRTVTSWQGYDKQNVIATQSYGNDTNGYTQFVNALNYAGYTKSTTADVNDTKGVCANGKVYEFMIMSGSSTTDDRWMTNCGVKGTFGGDGPAVRQLFLDQIPDASTVISQINI